MNMFEIATRKKFRFSYRGLLSVEDLWDLSAEELDAVFKTLNSKLKETDEESLLDSKTAEEKNLDTKISIVKYIFETKLAEQEARQKAIENKAKKQRILEIIKQKEDAKLESKGVEELQKMLDDLE